MPLSSDCFLRRSSHDGAQLSSDVPKTTGDGLARERDNTAIIAVYACEKSGGHSYHDK